MKPLWMLITVFLQTAYVSGYKHNSFPGVVLPNDPYVFINHDLKLTCNLTTAISETSTSLFFTKGGNPIPKSYVHILSSRSIQLIYPIVGPEDEGNYVCKLNRTGGGRPYPIGNQLVRVDYEPKKVEAIECRVYNWEKMTCEWDLGVNYNHYEHIDVQLVWTVRDAQQYDCPQITTNSCHWEAVDGRDGFRAGMLYYMMVIVRNKKTGNETKSKLFKEDTKTLVQPSSVSGLTTSHNSTCLLLQWHHSKSLHKKIYRMQYLSRWKASWEVLNLDDVTEKTICDLVPNTEYTIKIACKPLWDGFWSDEVETTIKLDEDVPGASPELQPGGFVEKLCNFQDCRVITVYWRPIMDRLANGDITNYKLTSHDRDGLDSPTQIYTGTRTSGQLMLSAGKDYVVDIQGETKKGLSPHTASVLILAKTKKPPYPANFIVEAYKRADLPHKFSLDIKWTEPTTKQRILGYTLFSCKGSSSDQMCLEPLKWAVLKGNQNNFSMTVHESEMQSLLYGISMETVHYSGETVSSGILWNDCIYRKNRKPLMAPKNVRVLSLIEENSLQVEWDRFKCSEMSGYITRYSVYYCSSQTEQNCSGRYFVEDVDGRKTSVTLRDMSPEATYRVWVQAKSHAGAGPQSDPVYTTIPVTGISLTTDEIAGIVISILLVVCLALIGFYCLFRRCAVEVKEQFRPYDIDLPNVPLPPIPMPRPSSKASTSPDSDDEIYSKIPENPPSPTLPESMSIDMPLINRESQNKSFYADKRKMYVKLPVSAAETLLSRFSIGRNSTEFRDNKNLSTFRPRPKKGSSGLSGSADMLSSNISPYSCVDIVQCPNSEKIPRKLIPCKKPCHSVGSMVDDPTYETNNLSVLSNKVVTNPPSSLAIGDSREHFNIKLPLDRRKSDIMNNTLNSCISNEINSVMETDEETQDSNEISEDKMSSYVQGAQLVEMYNATFVPADDYVQDLSCPKCSNNNDIKMRNGYVLNMENITQILPKPNIVIEDEDEGEGDTYKKELNIKPGPRPVSEVINVPAHFYGSLSLLDSGTATEL